ncbi:MAG TPA: hypothetical protein VIW19_02870 [Gaiellaceae bacterium]
MRLLLVLLALPLLSSCGGGAQQSSHSGAGGLQGKVVRGPITPTCSQNTSCTAPARGLTLTFSKDGKVVATVKTRDDGTYRVELPAGRYFVLGPQPVRPQHVDVSGEGFRRVDFSFDTKIR